MSNLRNVDYNLEVLRGNNPGHAMVFINGHNNSLTTTRITVHPGGTTTDIDQSVIEATPAKVKIASEDANDTSAGSGMRTVLISGLNSAGNAQIETITMNGQTEVTSLSTFQSINGMRAVTWGATKWNEGTVWVGTGSFTSGVPAVPIFSMEVRSNKGLAGYYVVPSGKTLFVRQLSMFVGTSNKAVEFFVEQGTNGTHFITEAILPLVPGASQVQVIAVPGLVAGTHVRLSGVSDAASTVVSLLLACELIDD